MSAANELVPLRPRRGPDPALVAALATAGPRYTSYPPATEFRAMTEAPARAVLAELGRADARLGLYVHVPFCRSLCWYCGCNVIPTRDAGHGDAYVDDLVREVELLASALGRRCRVGELALGGGSPNFLSTTAMARLLAALRGAFELADDARLSIELDPRTTDAAQVASLAAAGFRAASLGVQDFAPAVQAAIHRQQSVAQTAALVDALRAAGFDDVNVDLVYGLPQQTAASLEQTIAHVIELAPERIALFGYAHLPDRLPHQRLVERAGPVPDAHARAAGFLAASAQLQAAGYVAIGLDHFARPGTPLALAAAAGRLARTFQGYVERRVDATLGLGTSAISTTPGLIWQAPTALDAWRAALGGGLLPIARGVALTDDDRRRGRIIEALMCDGVVELGTVDAEPTTAFARELAALEGGPLAVVDRARATVTATELGRLLIRNVCQVFDARTGDHARFSPTI